MKKVLAIALLASIPALAEQSYRCYAPNYADMYISVVGPGRIDVMWGRIKSLFTRADATTYSPNGVAMHRYVGSYINAKGTRSRQTLYVAKNFSEVDFSVTGEMPHSYQRLECDVQDN